MGSPFIVNTSKQLGWGLPGRAEHTKLSAGFVLNQLGHSCSLGGLCHSPFGLQAGDVGLCNRDEGGI